MPAKAAARSKTTARKSASRAAAKPKGFRTRAEMPERYREMLEQMMVSQSYRELAAAHLFGHALQFVPSTKWIKFLSWHIREEVDHYVAVAKMYKEFTGADVEPKVRERLSDKPVPFVDTWFELAMAQFLYDRGGFWQLQEYEDCTFTPYRDVVRKIVSEEKGHQELGERIVVELCKSGAHDSEKQDVFERWLRLGLLSFGRPGSEGARYAIEVGLKKRDPALVMQDFLDDIKPAVRDGGLRFPPPESLKMDLPASLDWSL